MRFAKSINRIQGLQAYHAGDKLNVEVDIVVDEHTSLRDSHDLGESLQYVLGMLLSYSQKGHILIFFIRECTICRPCVCPHRLHRLQLPYTYVTTRVIMELRWAYRSRVRLCYVFLSYLYIRIRCAVKAKHASVDFRHKSIICVPALHLRGTQFRSGKHKKQLMNIAIIFKLFIII